jgi:hypothetical protein
VTSLLAIRCVSRDAQHLDNDRMITPLPPDATAKLRLEVSGRSSGSRSAGAWKPAESQQPAWLLAARSPKPLLADRWLRGLDMLNATRSR